MAKKIVVAQPLHESVLKRLQQHATVFMNSGPDPLSERELAEWCKDADAVMIFMTEQINDGFLQQCSKLKIVAGALKGYNNIDVAACGQRGILVTVVPDLLTEPTAELAIGLMIAVSRNLSAGDRYVRSGAFQGWRPRFYGGSLSKANVLIIGAGAVGQAIMRMLSGFDCKVTYVDTKPLKAEQEERLSCQCGELKSSLSQADFVVLAIHLTPDTKHLVDREFLSGMKKGSYLINPARGSVVNENDVATALESEHLGGYAADTFEMEDWALSDRPVEIPPALRQSEYTVLTLHIGSAVARIREEIEMSAADSIIQVLQGKFPDTVVNRKLLANSNGSV